MEDSRKQFQDTLRDALNKESFVKLTLGKKRNKSQELKNIYVRLLSIKGKNRLSFTYRYAGKDMVKNFDPEKGIGELEKHLAGDFLKAHLFTTQQDAELSIDKTGRVSLRVSAPVFTSMPLQEHDSSKKRFIKTDALYLQKLGISTADGKLIPGKTDKFKQINKYIEIVDALLKKVKSGKKLRIVDMGSGKGYLPFALYDYLQNVKNRPVEMLGVEQRQEMVDFCNGLAADSNFKNLQFCRGSIQETETGNADVLIALHACDTATDDAIFKGIKANASLIICAPCCHKQIRKQIKASVSEQPMLKHGILKERQAEILTDTIRALIMETFAYETSVFEFVSGEHTAKNLMIAGCKTEKNKNRKAALDAIEALKKQFGIEFHYLEKLLQNR